MPGFPDFHFDLRRGAGRFRSPRFCAILLAAVCTGGCSIDDSAEGATDYMDDQPPSGNCVTGGATGCATEGTGATGTTGTTGGAATGGTGGAPDECLGSDQCPAGQICVAGFDGKERTPLVCVPAGSGCVPPSSDPAADALWCADDAACCDPNTRCSKRGLCEPVAGDAGTGTGTGG